MVPKMFEPLKFDCICLIVMHTPIMSEVELVLKQAIILQTTCYEWYSLANTCFVLFLICQLFEARDIFLNKVSSVLFCSVLF